ncbi:MAG: sigma-54 interaction domain-containing protein [Bacillota bacterium]
MNAQALGVLSFPKVTLLTNEDISHRFFADQLRRHLGSLVEIEGYSLEGGLPARIDSTVVVATTDLVLRQASSRIAPGTATIVARRGVSNDKMEEILSLPRGSRVLLVSRDLGATEETARILCDLGMDHVEYLPWAPGIELPAANIAITPGASHLVPPHIQQVIDIGLRPLDLSTLIDIVVSCGLSWEVVNSIAFEHTRAMVRLNQRLSSALTQVRESNTRLEALIGSLDEGVVYIDRGGIVKVYNRTAQDLLGVSEKIVRGKNLSAIIGRKTIGQTLSSGLSNHSIEEVRSRKISMTTIPVKNHGEISGAICVLRDISQVSRLEQEIVRSLRSGHTATYTVNDIVGESPATKRMVERIRRIGETDLTVLISGESGVGKEVAAQAIHNLSSSRHGPFVAVNFAALPENLAESELFGYEEGAFTGARRGGHRGYFEEAHKGTVFLDEIGDASPAVQASLLRVLQEKRVTRVGGSRVIPLDFRVIAATNRPLAEMVAEGKFRRDLYYRLNVLHLTIPPLRDRKEDIPLLIDHFLRRWGGSRRFEPEAMKMLMDHDWPGNVREVESIAANIALAARGSTVTVEDLPEAILAAPQIAGRAACGAHSHMVAGAGEPVPSRPGAEQPLPQQHDEIASIIKVLESHGELHLYREILECLDGHSGTTGIGRATICRSIPSAVEPHRVRRYLRHLIEAGACVSGTTREGTRITAKGKALLGWFRSH